MGLLEDFEKQYLKPEKDVPVFRVGDTVKVHHKIVEGDKSRTQIFQGIVIRFRGGGLNRNFTVRKMSFAVGVEKTFPLHSPAVEKVQIVKSSKVRRARLYFLRGRSGKGARLRDKMQAQTAK